MAPSNNLDKIDEEIIALLFSIDGRMKLTEIGEKIKVIRGKEMSHVAVRNRLNNLIENKIIKIQPNLNVNKLDYISAFIMIKTSDSHAKHRIYERYRLCPRIQSIDTIMGKYDLIIRVMARDIKIIDAFLSESWIKHEKVDLMDVFHSTTNAKPIFLPILHLSEEQKFTKKAPCGRNCQKCEKYIYEVCPGCPATKFFKN